MCAFTRDPRSTCFFLLVVLIALFIPYPATAKTGADLVPADAFGYVQLGDVYQHIEAIMTAPEWKELAQIERAQMAMEEVNKMVPVVQMITGMTWQEFVKTFGRQITLILLSISDKPGGALVFDIGASKALAQDALDQLLILMAADGEFNPTPETQAYAGVSFHIIETRDGSVIRYTTLDNLLVFALNDGFERVIDAYQGKTPSIAATPEYQDMVEKIPPSGTAYAYLNLRRTIPALRASEAAKTGEAPEPPDEMEEAILASPQAMAIKLDLLGDAHEAYLRIAPQGPAMLFSPLLLSEHPKLASVNLLPAIDGLFIGLQIGEPLEVWRQISGLAAMMGQNLDGLVDALEAEFGFHLEDDILDALTGEIGVGISLPGETVNLKDNPLDLTKFQPFVAVGVKDREKFERLPVVISPFVQIDEFASSAQKAESIRRGIVTVDRLAPGAALALWYTFADGLFIAGTSRNLVETIAKHLKTSTGYGEGGKTPNSEKTPVTTPASGLEVAPWVMGYLNVGRVAEFLVRQNLDGNLELPEDAATKLASIGAIRIAYGAESDGVKLTVVTDAQKSWIANVLNALTVVAYAQQH
jgi:hypothetical protein